MANELIVTVSQLNRRVALMLKNDKGFAGLSVRGEISNFTVHSKSGHIYFSLKDEAASVKAVMFRSNAKRLTFLPQNGMSVIVVGSVQCYERDGVYQIYVSRIIPAGAGEQAVAQKQLKERLLKEGIFAQKRPRPRFPKKICVITAETGAALQDILNILGRRDPLVHVVLIPALVQGSGAPDSICGALERANRTDADLILFGRGGGSAEDLSAFNTEQVARAVYASRIPTISAVGHETDWCVADLAADFRAPTPSAAAELAVPDREELLSFPCGRLMKIRKGLEELLLRREGAVVRVFEKIQANSPRRQLAMHEKLLEMKRAEIRGKMKRLLSDRERRLTERTAVLSALNPLAVLMRGYTILYKHGKAISHVSQLNGGDEVRIRLNGGFASAAIRAVYTEEEKNEI